MNRSPVRSRPLALMSENKNNQAWEQEYRDPRFLTLGTEPASYIRDLMRWFKKQARKNPADFSVPLESWTVFDAGCGNGKNLKYIIENFCKFGIGYDISETAIAMAQELAGKLHISYKVASFGEKLPLVDNSFDLVLDVTSSNSLNKKQRKIFLDEIARTLKPNGYFFVRTLCLDGDANAKKLLADFPGDEPGTYVLPNADITENVFSEQEFLDTYARGFEVVHLEKKTGYQKWGNQSYKRNYWMAYLQKKK